MLQAIDAPEGLLVSMAGTCRVLCPAHGGEDTCTVEVQYRTRYRSIEAGSLRDYLASFFESSFFAEDLADHIRADVANAIGAGAMVTVRHEAEGVRLIVVAGAL